MTERKEFHPLQAQEIARAFNDQEVDYLFIGKSGAEYEKAHAPQLRSASDITADTHSKSP